MTERKLSDLIYEIGYLATVGQCACEIGLPMPADKRLAALEHQFEVIARLADEASEAVDKAAK